MFIIFLNYVSSLEFYRPLIFMEVKNVMTSTYLHDDQFIHDVTAFKWDEAEPSASARVLISFELTLRHGTVRLKELLEVWLSGLR